LTDLPEYENSATFGYSLSLVSWYSDIVFSQIASEHAVISDVHILKIHTSEMWGESLQSCAVDNQGSIHGRGSQHVKADSGPRIPEIMWPECEADHLPPSSA
jgi:hypothetical protein